MPRDFQLTIDFLANAAAKWPNKPSVICGERSFTYADVERMSAELAAGLRDRYGVGPGTRVGIAMRNRGEIAAAYWAAQRLGAAVLPINYRLGTQSLRHLLAEADLACLICDAAGWQGLKDAAGDIRARTIAVEVSIDGAAAWDDMFGHGTAAEYTAFDTSSPAVILYTSGTTGLPKGAVMTHETLMVNVRVAVVAHSLRHEDVYILAIPFFVPTACYSLINAAAYLGATLVMAPDPDMATVVPLIEKWRCSVFFGVPTLFFFLTTWPALSRYDVSSLRLIAYSGSPMPTRTIRKLRELLPGVWLHNFFGLTETIAMTHVLADCYADTHPESIGKLLPEVDAAVVGEDGRRLPPGAVGELVFRRDIVIPEYWGRPGLLEESIKNGWFHTGDLASVDNDGFFYVHGRSKDMIIVAGQNVYALEVEQVIMRMEQVREVAVVGVPATGVREALGELIKAVVVPHP
ncbi:MAG: acyl--CoA ligase, partial [Armatimonadetes bacterium]|nr:acyl--CoA ligase [Armatimonadota bacterium]